MANIKIVDLQPAFNKQIFKYLVLWYGTEVFARFFFPKNNPKKMSQIEEWLRNTKSFFHIMPQIPPTIPMIIVTVCTILVIFIMIIIGISPQSNKILSAIVGIVMYLVVIGFVIYFSFTIPSSKLLEVFENLRDYNLIDYHVEPYECQIAVYKDGRFKKQTGYVGITDDGRVVGLSRELRFVELGIGYNIELNQNFMRQEILKVYRKKFGAKQQTDETNVVVRL